jgi:DNA-binding beta-propeller fold protein YncE
MSLKPSVVKVQNHRTFGVGPSPIGVAFDGAHIWVGNRSSNTVTKLRAVDGVTLGTFVAGNGPGNLAFDGANMWVINQGAGTLSKL